MRKITLREKIRVNSKEIREFLIWLFKYYKKNNFIPQDGSDWGLYLGILGVILSIVSIVLKRFGL